MKYFLYAEIMKNNTEIYKKLLSGGIGAIHFFLCTILLYSLISTIVLRSVGCARNNLIKPVTKII